MTLISLFIIPLILFFIREKILKNHVSKYKSIIDYVIFTLFLNGATLFLIWASLFKDSSPIMMVRGLDAWLHSPLPYSFEMLKIAVPAVALEKLCTSILIPRIKKWIRHPRLEKITKKSGTVILYVTFFLLMTITISRKENYFIDELFSYGLSNNVGQITMIYNDGVKYDPQDVLGNYVTVSSDRHRFDYKNVWINQKIDVHPPFYYTILHTICSLFPGTFSGWYAGCINIISSILTLYFIRKICRILTSSQTITTMISIGFIFSSGILYTAAFFWMYSLAMFWITAQTCLILHAADERNCTRQLYAGLFITTVLGALTHYYCIVFDVFISIAYGIYLLVCKNYKSACKFVAVQSTAGLISYLVFPPMLVHMSFGYRGAEAVKNLVEGDDYWPRLKNFFSFIDIQIFGGFLGYLLCGIVAALIVCFLFHKNKEYVITDPDPDTKQNQVCWARYLILIAPLLVYFFAVSKMAAFQSDRYLYPVYAVSFVVVLCLLSDLVKYIFGQKALMLMIPAVLSMTIIGSWQNITWEYLYRGSGAFLEKVSKYSDYDCLCIHSDYSNDFMLPVIYCEAMNYKSISFMQNDSMEYLKNLEIADTDKLIVTVISLNDPERYVKEVLTYYPKFTGYQYLGGHGGNSTYVLKKN